MAGCIDTETIDTHLDELAIALYEILCHLVVLSVKVYTVASNLTHPTAGEVPVPVVGCMVPVVVYVVVLSICILHQSQTALVLLSTYNCEIVGAKHIAVRNHTSVDFSLVTKLGVALKLLAEILLTKVTGVVEHDVKYNLDALSMCLVDEFLEHYVATLRAVTALIAAVDMCEVHGMVAMIVVTRCVLHYWGNPDGCEAKSLDIVELVDDALEVASPTRVASVNLTLFVIPTQYIVFRIAIVETGGNHKVDTFVAKIRSLTVEIVCHNWHGDEHKQ